jgi:hypothetical protein
MLVAVTTIAVISFDDHKTYAKKDNTNKKNGASRPGTEILPIARKDKID